VLAVGRRPDAAFVSGKRKQNTIMTTTISDRPRTHPVVTGGAAGRDARPDRDAHRRHR
jgi:hypothetical protein